MFKCNETIQELEEIRMKHDDFKEYMSDSEKPYIKMEDLKDGYLYRIHARNGMYGIYKEDSKEFHLSRIKFGDNFLFPEYHYDIGEVNEKLKRYGTVKPLKEIEKAPFDLHKRERGCDDSDILDYLNDFEMKGR